MVLSGRFWVVAGDFKWFQVVSHGSGRFSVLVATIRRESNNKCASHHQTFSPRHFRTYLSLWGLSLIHLKEPFMQVLLFLLVNVMVPLFMNAGILLILFEIFFISLL